MYSAPNRFGASSLGSRGAPYGFSGSAGTPYGTPYGTSGSYGTSQAPHGLHGGSSATSWICLAAAVVLAFALVMPTGIALMDRRPLAPPAPPQPPAVREAFKTVTSRFPYGDRLARQVSLESLALSHAKTGDYSVANTLLADSKRRRESRSVVSGPSGVRVMPRVVEADQKVVPAAKRVGQGTEQDVQAATVVQQDCRVGYTLIDGDCKPIPPIIDEGPSDPPRQQQPVQQPVQQQLQSAPPPGWRNMNQVTTLKFDGVTLDRAWLSSASRKNTYEGLNGGRQVSLLDAFLSADGTVSAGRTTRTVYRMAYGFSGNNVVVPGGDGYTYELGKLALHAHLADKPVGANGDVIRVRYFGSINQDGKLDTLAYAEVKNNDPIDTWAYRRVNIATKAQSFCMFTEPACTLIGRGPGTTTEFMLYTSKAGGPEGATSSQELNARGDTCTLGGVLGRHMKDMAWWSFE